MKMRKTLSFVLVLALVLGSFSMVFAADGVKQGSDLSDISGNVNYDAIVANSDLGIITGYEDGSYKPANNVNRAEFAAMITRMMGVPDSALAGYSSTNFTDMSGYGWANSYVGFCAAKGIVNGYGNGTFGPGNTITVNEAVTMVLRAVGYVSNSNELVGTWPSNYVTLGKRLGIYDDVTSTATIDRANAAQVIYNSLTAVVVAVNADGDTKDAYTTGSGDNYYAKNVLEVYLDCTLYGDADDLDKDGFGVYPYEAAQDSVVNTMGYVGAYVKAFANDDGDVVAIAESKSTFLTGKYDVDDEEFTVGDTDYTLTKKNLEKARAALVNMKDITPLDSDKKANIKANSVDKDVDGLFDGYVDTTGSVTLAVDVSAKTIKEVYSVHKLVATDAVFYEKDMLESDNLDGYDFALGDDNEIDNGLFQLNGVTGLDKIAEDNIVEVFTYGTDKKSDIVRVDIGTKTVTGKITMYDDGDYKIDGTVYGKANPFADGKDSLADNDDVVGDTGTAYLNFRGDIAGWELEDAASDNYAIVSGAYDNKTTSRDETIVLVDKTGTEKEYVLKNTGTNEKAHDATTLGNASDVGTIVTFGLDKNGKIDEFTIVSPVTTVSTTSDSEVNKNRTIYDNNKIDSGVVVFTYDDDAIADSDFDVIPLSDLETEKPFTVAQGAKYYVDSESGKIKAMLVPDKYTGANTVYAVINKIKKSTNSDDDDVLYVKGFADGKSFEWYTEDDTCGVLSTSYDVTKAADYQRVFELTLNAAGEITDAEYVDPVTVPGGDLGVTIQDGYVWDKDGSSLKINSSATSNTGAAWKTLDDETVQYYTYDKGDEEFSAAKLSDIKKGELSGSTVKKEPSLVWVWQVDDDSDAYDFVVIFKAKSDTSDDDVVGEDTTYVVTGYNKTFEEFDLEDRKGAALSLFVEDFNGFAFTNGTNEITVTKTAMATWLGTGTNGGDLDTIAVTGDNKLVVEDSTAYNNAVAQAAVNAEAADVALTLAASGSVNDVVMPAVDAAFTIAVKTTSNLAVYNTSGEILTNGTSDVVYTVTHTTSGKTADTGTVVVTVSGL